MTRQNWKALLIAAAVVVVGLFTVVLPAKYGYDPTGAGKALGLAASDQPKAAGEPSLDQVIDDVIGGNDNLVAAADASPSVPTPLPNPAVSQIEELAPKTETITVHLDFDGKTEVKAKMHKAKAIVYSWTVENGGKAYVDFHGHDPALGDNFWVRYEEADGITGRSGSLVAPFDGEHGWFWLNASEQPITIKLTVTGYFDKLIDYGKF